MDFIASATDALRLAEESLRDLVAKAATSEDYASVVLIASWAQAVKDISSGKSASSSNGADVAVSNGRRRGLASAKAGKGSAKEERTRQYPKFFRRGDQLIRVAWSKRDRSEYQHKTSQMVLQGLADAIFAAGKDGRVFSTDEILPVHDDDGRQVPAYQAYVCIALLKQTRLIDQHGRQGYSIPRLPEFKDAIAAVWKNLPTQ